MPASRPGIDAAIFDAASAPVRMEILKLLASRGPLSYTEIMSSLKMDPVKDAGKFVYHLKSLIGAELVSLDKQTKKYAATDLGKMVVNFARDVQEHINVRRGKLYVRTSRLTIEKFDRSKIARSLVLEAGVPKELADEIAAEAEDRLIRLGTTYLTAPLIREFVNSILIEKRLEEYRHKLTRLGMPVYDVTQMLRMSGERRLTADEAHRAAGSSVMAEYVLLESLPHEIADAHLSGAIHINNLGSWALKPEEVQHDLRFFLERGLPSVRPPRNLEEALSLVQAIYRLGSAEIAGEQSIEMFNIFLAPFVGESSVEKIADLLVLFFTSIRQDMISNATSPGLTLCLEFMVPRFLAKAEAIGPGRKAIGSYADFSDDALAILDAAIEAASRVSAAKPLINPRLVFKVRRAVWEAGEHRSRLLKIHRLAVERGLPHLVYLSDDSMETYTATGLRLADDWTGGWEADCLRTGSMDTIFINLPRIAYESERNDGRFFALLEDTLELVIEAFKVKGTFIAERLKQPLLPLLSGVKGARYFMDKNAAYTVAAMGLNEAVVAHTGEPPRRGRASLDFAEKIIANVIGHLQAHSEELGLRFAVGERPCDDGVERLAELDVEKYGRSRVVAQGSWGHVFYTDMPTVPLTAKLSLDERLELEGSFQKIMAGGHMQPIVMAPAVSSAEGAMKATQLALSNGVRCLTYTANYSYCMSCDRTEEGILSRCPSCGSGELSYIGRPSATLLPFELWPEAKRRAVEARIEYGLSSTTSD